MSEVSQSSLRPVEFDEGIKRGDNPPIMKLQVRKPGGGELRGLSTIDVVRQDYNTIKKLAPRVSLPMITEAEVDTLDPADLLTLGSEIAAFFLTRQQRAEGGLDT